MSARLRHAILGVYTAAVLAYLLVPVLITIAFSFNSSKSLQTFEGLSFEWYEAFFADGELVHALWISLALGLIAMIGSTIIGTLFALGLFRFRGRGNAAMEALVLLPMVTPDILLAVALLMLFTQMFLVHPSFLTLAFGHVTLGLAYMTIAVRARLARIGPEPEEAAMDLGATPIRAVWLVVIPRLVPAIVTSALLVFAVSLDDFSIGLFNSGQGDQPIPVRIWSMLQVGVTPTINAIAAIIVVLTLAAIIAAVLAGRIGGQGRQRSIQGFGDAF